MRAVVFDIGETLVDETRIWTGWADWLGVPRLAFLAALGAVIARGGHHREVFELFRPGLDVGAARRARAAAGEAMDPVASDLYPDAVPCLAALDAAGYRLAIVGNQPAGAEAVFRELGIPLAFAAASETWTVHKPDPAFFGRILSELALPAAAVAYVGDRHDNDIRPAAAPGLRTVWVRRGPWAWIQAGRSRPPAADVVVGSLAELPEALVALG